MQRGQVGHAQRNLVDHAEGQVRRAAAGQHHLVVLGRVAAQKHQLHGAQVTPVGLGETQHVFVKARHAFEVAHIKAHVAEHQGAALAQG